MHRLASLLADAARGVFPPPDGTVEVVGPPAGRADAVVAFTAHTVVACPLSEAEVRAQLEPGDLGAATAARFLVWLGSRLGASPGSLDALLVAPRTARPPRESLDLRRVDASSSPRVARAARYRSELATYGVDGGVLVLGRGLANRLEVAIEVEPDRQNRGLGQALARAAVRLAPPDEPLFAQVAPGNAASLRTFLAAGYRPIGAEVLFLRGGNAETKKEPCGSSF
jgi:GNAT superfamily N-acetyltransferase